MPENVQLLNPMLRWPHWPGPGGPDPGPDWGLIVSRLDKTAVMELAGIQLDLMVDMLHAQIHAVEKMKTALKIPTSRAAQRGSPVVAP